MPGFRISTDFGKTWTPSPLSPEPAAVSRAEEVHGPGEDGLPALRRFRQEHGAFARRQGVSGRHGRRGERSAAALRQPELDHRRSGVSGPRDAESENINDITKYEFFAGHDAAGKPLWTSDFAKIKPLLDWNNNMGCVTVTYNRAAEEIPDVRHRRLADLREDALVHPRGRRDHRPVAAGGLHEGFRRAGLLPQLPLEVHRADGRTLWLCYSANFAPDWNGAALKINPPGGRYGLCLHEVRLLVPGETLEP